MQEQGGFVKIYRKMLEWEWYDDVNTKVVFLHILLKANWKETKYHGETIYPGEYKTTLPELSEDLGLSIKNVRTALEHLKAAGCLAVRKNPKFSIISIKNWGQYQSGGSQNGSQTAVERQSNGSQAAVSFHYIEEEKEKKNSKKRENGGAASPPSLSEIADYVHAEGYHFSPERFFTWYEEKNWRGVDDWKKKADLWELSEKHNGGTSWEREDNCTFDVNDLDRFSIL